LDFFPAKTLQQLVRPALGQVGFYRSFVRHPSVLMVKSGSGDLKQLRERMKQREKEQAKTLGEANKFLKGRPGLAEKTRL